MADYFAFGGCFRSELEFPDLTPWTSGSSPDWEVEICDEPPPPGVVQGSRDIEPGWTLRLHRLDRGWRLQYDPSGSYVLREGGRRIVWHPGQDRREEVARAVILGPAMALALHDAGVLCLHGSAIVAGEGAIGFLAPKGYGKSTLAAALMAAGGRLISDDLVPVRLRPEPEVVPAVHSLRLRPDSATIMSREFPEAYVREGWKGTLTHLPPTRLAWKAAPLAALYLIHPTSGGLEEGRRTQLESMDGVLGLVRHTKLTEELIGHEEAGKMLGWIAEVVARVPVYSVHIPRDLDHLAEMAVRILDWHDEENARRTKKVGSRSDQ